MQMRACSITANVAHYIDDDKSAAKIFINIQTLFNMDKDMDMDMYFSVVKITNYSRLFIAHCGWLAGSCSYINITLARVCVPHKISF